MPKQMTPEERREYMRAYRARQKAKTITPEQAVEIYKEQTLPPPKTISSDVDARKLMASRKLSGFPEADDGEVLPKLEHRMRRQRVASKWTNPYTDGYPDWPVLIQCLTQKKRDEILDRVNRGDKFGKG